MKLSGPERERESVCKTDFWRQYCNLMNRITIKDVARAAGVSASAVSRVFTEGASASVKTREKVLAAADLLGYRPSLLARGLVSNRTNMVTLVMGRMTDPFDALFMDSFAEAMARRGTRLMLSPVRAGASEEDSLLQALDYQSDAVIVSAGTMSLAHSERCVRAGLPVILAGRVLEAPGVDCVLADNRDGGRQAAELLLRTGCRSLTYLGQGGATFSDRERRDGFGAAVTEAGVTFTEQAVGGRADAEAFSAATELLSRLPRPDGIFCSNDNIAICALEACQALGLAVPGDVAIVGFNNLPDAARRSFQLTTLDYPVSKVVAEICNLLDLRGGDFGRESEIRRISTQLVVRSSTRARGTAG